MAGWNWSGIQRLVKFHNKGLKYSFLSQHSIFHLGIGMELNSKGELIRNFSTMELKLDTLDTLRYPPPIGVELNSKKFFTKRTLRSPLTEKKFGISIPSPNREFNPIQSEGSEGFVTYRSSRYRFTRVKLNFSEETWRRGWIGKPFFFLSNKSWRVKVPVCIIPSGKVEIIKISNFQTGVRREKTYDWAAWDGQCRGFPYRACELRSNFELGKLETGEKKKKKKNCFLFDAWWRHRKITSFPTIIRLCWLGYVFVVAVFWKVFVILFFSLSLFFRWEKKIWKSFELPNRIWEECK